MRPWERLEPGILLRRYKRFLADVRLADGSTVTAHCPNSGSMLGMRRPGSEVLLSHHDNPRRKLPWTLEMVRPAPGGAWVGCNTMRPNAVVADLLGQGLLPIDASGGVRREVRLGASRIDMVATAADGSQTFVEVKNTTLAGPHEACSLEDLDAVPGTDNVAFFPDAITDRGARHMAELASLARSGGSAAVVFFVNRADCSRFAAASTIDPAYAASLADAVDAGVQVVPVGMSCGPDGWVMRGTLPWRLTA